MDARRSGALAIDPGQRRCGFAVADPLRLAVNPLPPCATRGGGGPGAEGVFRHLERLVAERDIGVLVVGLPLNMDGSEGPGAARARSFASSLARRFPSLRVVAFDERLTTKAAEELGREIGLRGAKARALRDSLSAVVLLRDWIAAGEPFST